jgi:trans-aconitate methyltransferase
MSSDPSRFDGCAESYDADLARGLSLSGESRDHFARGRVGLLAELLARTGDRPRRLVDLGCGTGDTAPVLESAFDAESVLGVDTSARSLELAAQRFSSPRIRFSTLGAEPPCQGADLVYCNGVLHHVPPPERPALLALVRGTLRRGGIFALWENNPWNPGTRLIMSRVAFDRDAIMVSPLEARRLVRAAGLEVLRVDFLFVFPRALAALRPLERLVTRAPLGGQYQVLCRAT